MGPPNVQGQTFHCGGAPHCKGLPVSPCRVSQFRPYTTRPGKNHTPLQHPPVWERDPNGGHTPAHAARGTQPPTPGVPSILGAEVIDKSSSTTHHNSPRASSLSPQNVYFSRIGAADQVLALNGSRGCARAHRNMRVGMFPCQIRQGKQPVTHVVRLRLCINRTAPLCRCACNLADRKEQKRLLNCGQQKCDG